MRRIFNLALLSFSLLVACTNTNESHDKLIGNWHSGISELPILPSDIRTENDYSYAEYVYSENFMHQYTNNSSIPYALKYTMRQDSLFFYVGTKQREQFVGVLVYPNDSTLYIYSFSDTIVHHKMKKLETTLDKYINDDLDEFNPFENIEDYDPHFQSRFNIKLKEFTTKE